MDVLNRIVLLLYAVALIVGLAWVATKPTDIDEIEERLAATYDEFPGVLQALIDSQPPTPEGTAWKSAPKLPTKTMGGVVAVDRKDFKLSKKGTFHIPEQFWPKNGKELSYVIVRGDSRSEQAFNGYYQSRPSSPAYEKTQTRHYIRVWLIDWQKKEIVYSGEYSDPRDQGTVGDWFKNCPFEEFLEDLGIQPET